MAERIGILGGTFDPVHNGHLTAAVYAQEELSLQRVLLLPNNNPPLKSSDPRAPFADRVAMLKLAAGASSALDVSEIEGQRPGISYTVDTLLALRDTAPDTQYYLILGQDALREFHLWREHERVAELAQLVGIPRGVPEQTGFPVAHQLTMPRLDISSSLIRRRIAAGQSVISLVPTAVAAYIAQNQLYRAS
jgi:nicotinate-nucleotide adenylyltransferase